MPQTNTNLNRLIQHTLYMLKRQYGGCIDIYRRLGGDVDPKTGKVTVNKELIKVNRAIILTAKVMRTAERPINVISANKAFTLGGSYDRNTRVFIVDRRDVPKLELQEFELTADDWIVYNGIKYQIKSFELIEFEAAWAITGQAVLGDIPEQIFEVCADNLIRPVQGATDAP